MKKKCPKCKGKGCSHCGGTGYHENMAMGGMMKKVPEGNKGLGKLPKDVRNKMGYMMHGGKVKKGYNKGGKIMANCGASVKPNGKSRS